VDPRQRLGHTYKTLCFMDHSGSLHSPLRYGHVEHKVFEGSDVGEGSSMLVAATQGIVLGL